MNAPLGTLRPCVLAAGCVVVLLLGVSSAFAIPAFPGAEGYGAVSAGGRGGNVYHVTSLADTNTPGTLRYGITTAGTTGRTIVFDISGTIYATSEMLVERKRYVTIAGQTAPAGGITIAGQQTRLKYSDNIVIRHLRFRAGDTMLDEDGLWIYGASDTIVDHCSASWSLDEVLSLTGTPETDPKRPQPQNPNITVQWSVIAEGLNAEGHGYGSLFRPHGNANLSVHHCLYEHNYSRNPRPGNYNDSTLNLDFRNNVIYDWADQAGYNEEDGNGRVNMNYAGNYLIAGPDTKASTRTNAFDSGSHAIDTQIYQSGNKIDGNLNGIFDGTDTGWGMFSGTYTQLSGSFALPAGSGVYTLMADAALTSVLTGVGDTASGRDSVDTRLIQDVYNGTGGTIDSQNDVGGWPTIPSVSRPAGWDTDNDGMPNTWETARGLNPSVANNNADYDADGYTDLEEYLNWIAPIPAPKTITYTGGTAGRYELIANWDIPWQPSRLDAAEINSGKATVAYIGQEAGTLYVGNTASSNGELAVTAGSLALTGQLILGNAAAAKGTANLTGGSLTATGAIVLASASSSTGVLNVSKDAYVKVAGLTINTGSGRSAKVGVELDGNTQSLIQTTGASTLGGLMDVQVLSGYRPREGDEFAVITSTDPNAVYFTGNFSSFTSNITYGLPPASSPFGGGASGDEYAVVFLGYTHGDANGDHSVDGGDLSLMGGNWMVSTTGWGNCDFNNDGLVDGGDLALMGGNWMWSLPGGAPQVPLPEPATLAVLALGVAALVRRRRQQAAG